MPDDDDDDEELLGNSAVVVDPSLDGNLEVEDEAVDVVFGDSSAVEVDGVTEDSLAVEEDAIEVGDGAALDSFSVVDDASDSRTVLEDAVEMDDPAFGDDAAAGVCVGGTPGKTNGSEDAMLGVISLATRADPSPFKGDSGIIRRASESSTCSGI